jgi:4'-phosphopantetheinyl transferase
VPEFSRNRISSDTVIPNILPNCALVPELLGTPGNLAGALVWIVHDDEPLPAWVPASEILSCAERDRAERTHHPRARQQFVRGRTILRAALGMHLGVHPLEVPLVVSADGKPELLLPGIHFNISHTDGAAVFAVSGQPIGVDVERPRAGRDWSGLVARFFAPEEQAQFLGLPTELRSAAFLRGWTCKEALLKGIGSGVRDLQNCAVELDPREEPRVLRSPVGCGNWKLTCWEVDDSGTVAALAIDLNRSAS